jgi:hypothetical protein
MGFPLVTILVTIIINTNFWVNNTLDLWQDFVVVLIIYWTILKHPRIIDFNITLNKSIKFSNANKCKKTIVAPKRMQLYKNMLQFTNMDRSWFVFWTFTRIICYINYLILSFFVHLYTFEGNGNPQHSCQIPMDLNLYPPLEEKKLIGVNAKSQLKVGYWASRNGLHDDKIYKTIIKMFIPKCLSNLPQP